jgi:enoyl-CoA hydratase/carnithine racemase
MTSSNANKPLVKIEIDGDIACLTLDRAEKRNAVSDALITELASFFMAPPEGIHAVILQGSGGHFCAGLDLAEHEQRPPIEGVYHSRNWHRVLDLIEFGGLPVVSVLTGAVIGGGLEIATSTHVRIAETGVRFQLPEGRRGIFVGGGATVRVGRILGPDRMREMMLTGRTYSADDGLRLGLAHYSVGKGEGLEMAKQLARQIAGNAPFSNYLMIQALPRIHDMARGDGLFAESLAAAMSQTSDGAKEGLRAFLEKRPPKFR